MHYSLGSSIYDKRILYLAAIVVIVLLVFVGIVRRNKEEETSAEPTYESTCPDATPSVKEYGEIPIITVYNHKDNKKEEMSLEDYVIASVAGEMPASFDEEALKAQAICSRTLAYQRLGKGESCENCDICTDSSHGQGCLTCEQMQKIWENDYNKWYSIIKSCVESTQGEVITYNNQLIEVMYHASSNGMTENSGDVFVSDKPYLVSVASFDEDLVVDTVNYSLMEFVDMINASYPNAKMTLNTALDNINIVDRTQSGRVDKIKLGDITLTGREFRQLLSLKSTEFEIHADSLSVIITTKGYGHGVGMSQRGANQMAQKGYNCYDVLSHYFVGTEIVKVY